ncbi:glycosyltransferase family 25 protein [Mesorhizobium sp. ESP-6-2]|uniref:glycosyltransferase family 25 protein n=1 Tax=Mesorhizobium sp. ESP-6-2 TaxID=2876625 RepID=UPI001CCE384A|nr:glycosyltransferase family 25 protein [Mesorhizobium sp. ESP-6-2]
MRSLHFGTAGYIISKSAAKRLLKLTERFSDPVDHVMFNPAFGVARGLKTYQILPALCVQSYHLYPEGPRPEAARGGRVPYRSQEPLAR